MVERALFEYFSEFRFGKRNAEIFAKDCEFADIDLIHDFLEVIELTVKRNVLSTVKMEDLHETLHSQLVYIWRQKS